MVKSTKSDENKSNEPHCQYFVTRKKRLCRMTVRPGRQYCGEHEPQPKADNGKIDERIPCPNDPKHTCYISKLEKHLAICNARPGDLPPYIVPNVNAPPVVQTWPRKPLNEIPQEVLMLIINKINALYDEYIKDNISTAAERPIHSAVMEEFSETDRTESSLRHLRQASQLLWLAEEEGLVQEGTCYVELGAGKGQLSYYVGVAWCGGGSRVLLVDRASLRHKRDNRVRGRCERLRADLAHLVLARVPLATDRAVVGVAKHLCGVATDYALRCLTAAEVAARVRGAVLATCCHHRCERARYVAGAQLQELGIDGEELNAMLGIVSWATCGSGRPRAQRGPDTTPHSNNREQLQQTENELETNTHDSEEFREQVGQNALARAASPDTTQRESRENELETSQESEKLLTQEFREQVGRKAKAILDWGRILYLRELGFDARLCHYVPTTVSLENVCIVAKKIPST